MKYTTGILLSESTGLGSRGDLSLSTERGTIGKPVMLPRSGLLVRERRGLRRLPTMAKQTGVKRSLDTFSWCTPRRVSWDCVRDVGILYDFRSGSHGFSKLHRHAKASTDNDLEHFSNNVSFLELGLLPCSLRCDMEQKSPVDTRRVPAQRSSRRQSNFQCAAVWWVVVP